MKEHLVYALRAVARVLEEDEKGLDEKREELRYRLIRRDLHIINNWESAEDHARETRNYC